MSKEFPITIGDSGFKISMLSVAPGKEIEVARRLKKAISFLTEWNNKPIPLELEHINGEHNDNRIENLKLLCPNCHAQTPTYRIRKNKI